MLLIFQAECVVTSGSNDINIIVYSSPKIKKQDIGEGIDAIAFEKIELQHL